MKLLNGFGKKYFTLSSILAFAVAPKLHSVTTSFKINLNKKLSNTASEQEEEEPSILLQEVLLSNFIQNKKITNTWWTNFVLK